MSATSPPSVRCPGCGAAVATTGFAPGSRVVCGACRRPMTLPMPAAATPQRGGPIPPHLLGKGAAATSAAMAPVKPAVTPIIAVEQPTIEERTAPTNRVYGWLVLGGFGIGGVALLVFIGWLMVTGGLIASRSGTGEVSETVIVVEREAADEKWTDASKHSQAFQKVSLKLENFELGPVMTRDERGLAKSADDKDYLQIKFKLRNYNSQVLEYHGWYGNQFDVDGQVLEAVLVDDKGQAYPRKVFEGVSSIRGQAENQNLANKDTVTDILVFEVPEGAKVKDAQYFRLKLPCAAFGKDGWFRFELPRAMLEM